MSRSMIVSPSRSAVANVAALTSQMLQRTSLISVSSGQDLMICDVQWTTAAPWALFGVVLMLSQPFRLTTILAPTPTTVPKGRIASIRHPQCTLQHQRSCLGTDVRRPVTLDARSNIKDRAQCPTCLDPTILMLIATQTIVPGPCAYHRGRDSLQRRRSCPQASTITTTEAETHKDVDDKGHCDNQRGRDSLQRRRSGVE
eukprot:2760777-Rhodomonas_salina.1